jgi:hypothetical protein
MMLSMPSAYKAADHLKYKRQPLLAQFMTGGASDCGFFLLVAVHAPLHLHRLREFYFVLLHNISVATLALHLRGSVPAVIEENKFRQRIHTLRRDRSFACIHVTRFALRNGGERRQVASFGFGMARHALQFQWCVFLVAERSLHVSRVEGYGNE